jgi:hypothetical protein
MKEKKICKNCKNMDTYYSERFKSISFCKEQVSKRTNCGYKIIKDIEKETCELFKN